MKTLIGILLLAAVSSHAAIPPGEPQYRQYFTHFEDRRSLPEKLSNALGFEGKPIGRSHALIAGVSNYHAMNEKLAPVDADLEKLQSWLRGTGHFDEIVVLQDEAFSEKNLNYFLRDYFPKRLASFPRSRFLFAFSGHGSSTEGSSYLLTTKSNSFEDTVNVVEIEELRIKLRKTLDKAHQSLVLINSCYGGAFLSLQPFGNSSYLPTGSGSHAITAGRADEKVYADKRLGPGSVFFETFLNGLSGHADSLPSNEGAPIGDGIITINELASYISHQIKNRYQFRVNPLFADLKPKGSKGGFFFLTNRARIKPSQEPIPQPPGTSMGNNNRFIQISPNRVQDRILNCHWSLLGQGDYAAWKTAESWSIQSKATLPTSKQLQSLITDIPSAEQPIDQLLSQFDIRRTPSEFWSNTKKGFYRYVLNNVTPPPRITRKNPEDTCGVLVILQK